MTPTRKTAVGETRVVASSNFPAAKGMAAAMVTIKPGGIREMHWHLTVREWQYWMKGKGHMTVVTTGAKARTMDLHPNDVGAEDLLTTFARSESKAVLVNGPTFCLLISGAGVSRLAQSG